VVIVCAHQMRSNGVVLACGPGLFVDVSEVFINSGIVRVDHNDQSRA
jgi:hypothetical protein